MINRFQTKKKKWQSCDVVTFIQVLRPPVVQAAVEGGAWAR
jgi:hypothetical protein